MYSNGEFGPPKTRSRRRTIPISSSLIEIFKRLRPLSCEPETLVFTTSKGTPLNVKNLYNWELAPASDAIGLPRVSWYSFVTRMRRCCTNRANLSRRPKHCWGTQIWRQHSGCTPRNSGLAKKGCRASRGSFGPGWTRQGFEGNFEGIGKLMSVNLLSGKSGEPGRTRTCNPLIKSQLLYH